MEDSWTAKVSFNVLNLKWLYITSILDYTVPKVMHMYRYSDNGVVTGSLYNLYKDCTLYAYYSCNAVVPESSSEQVTKPPSNHTFVWSS